MLRARKFVAYALAFSLVTSSPIVANAATVSPDETMDDWSEIGSQSNPESPILIEPNDRSEVTYQPYGLWDKIWKSTSRVLLSEVECMSKLAYYEFHFKAIGACVPTPKGTWLLTVKWRD